MRKLRKAIGGLGCYREVPQSYTQAVNTHYPPRKRRQDSKGHSGIERAAMLTRGTGPRGEAVLASLSAGPRPLRASGLELLSGAKGVGLPPQWAR